MMMPTAISGARTYSTPSRPSPAHFWFARTDAVAGAPPTDPVAEHDLAEDAARVTRRVAEGLPQTPPVRSVLASASAPE